MRSQVLAPILAGVAFLHASVSRWVSIGTSIRWVPTVDFDLVVECQWGGRRFRAELVVYTEVPPESVGT